MAQIQTTKTTSKIITRLCHWATWGQHEIKLTAIRNLIWDLYSGEPPLMKQIDHLIEILVDWVNRCYQVEMLISIRVVDI